MDEKEKKINEFMLLYRPVQRQFNAYCRVIAINSEVAGDLIQDSLLTAFESFEKLRKTESFIYFLCSIARNKYLSQKRRWKFFAKESEIKPGNIVISSDPIEIQPDIELLYQAIAQLNNEQKDVLLLFHIMGFSIEEIQKQLGITEAAIKNRLMRARKRLKQMLADKEQPISANLSKTILL